LAEPPGGDKTEPPTPRRRTQAREKGDRLASRELATALAGIAGALWLAVWGPGLATTLFEATAAGLSLTRADVVDFRPDRAALTLAALLLVPLAALAALALAAAVAGQALTGGLGFTPALLEPKLERLDPLKGFARIFGPRGLVELVKALAKAALLLGGAALLLYADLPQLLALSAVPLAPALVTTGELVTRLMLWLTLGLALIAAADLPLQIRQWLKRLRMTKQEVKDEAKQQEGSPDVKQALRRLARDQLKRASRAAMADATVVLTNPTHFAVALRYRPELDAAPLIVARGRGLVAEVIRELAAEQGVALLSYPSVTRALYFTGRVGAAIRVDLYAPVAAILAFVLRVGGDGVAPDVEAPPSASYDEEGRRSTP
jgi:flagellar biosynthetic protein FlhB